MSDITAQQEAYDREVQRLNANPAIKVLSVSPLTPEELSREQARKDRLVTGPVAWDCGPVFTATYDPTDTWNGFLAAPYFTLDEVRRLSALHADSDQKFEIRNDDSVWLHDSIDTDDGNPTITRLETDLEGRYLVGLGWTWTPARTVTVSESVEQCKHEVLALIREEKIDPHTITTFGDLHEHTDANTLGFLCDEDVVFVLPEGWTVVQSESIDFANIVQSEVSAWINSGQHIEGPKFHRHPADVAIKTSLVVSFDVTGWNENAVNALRAEIAPLTRARIDYAVVEHDGDLDLDGVLNVGLDR